MHLHFSGIGGAGMNPLARLAAVRGHRVQGSDRDFDRGRNAAVADLLRAAGIQLLPQDGSAIVPGLDRVVHSAAVEADTPEMRAAAAHGIPCLPRPALLAEIVAAGCPGVAVAGTSGKSTVVGMLAWILRACRVSASVLGGAALAEADAHHMGLFAAAATDAPVVAEACESDGTLVDYHPGLGVLLNVSRDHGEIDTLRRQFARFAAQSARLVVDGDCPVARALTAGHPDRILLGTDAAVDWRLTIAHPGPWRGTATLAGGDGIEHLIDLPQPGVHNLRNAAAAVCTAVALGCDPARATAALRDFPGVARRFQVVGRVEGGITVVDDYAHNGAKIVAAITAAQLGCDRLVALFQPHGFGPARFLRDELRVALPEILRPQDRFCYLGIYDAGGTADRSITSADLQADLPATLRCGHAEDHRAALAWAAETVVPGDTVLVMGARDPRLGDLARALCQVL